MADTKKKYQVEEIQNGQADGEDQNYFIGIRPGGIVRA